jgi:hypothetical protein
MSIEEEVAAGGVDQVRRGKDRLVEDVRGARVLAARGVRCVRSRPRPRKNWSASLSSAQRSGRLEYFLGCISPPSS